MLFSRRFHDPIARGEVTRTIRRWKRPQARPGGRYRLPGASTIEVDSVTPIDNEDLTAEDATRSGFDSIEELRTAAPDRDGATLYRIDFHFVGQLVDPRTALAANADLDQSELASIAERLQKMDARSRRSWVRETLDQIDANPATVSHQLAAAIGFETQPFKANVRKLKTLGLTISLERGYELSPRGRAVLAYLESTT